MLYRMPPFICYAEYHNSEWYHVIVNVLNAIMLIDIRQSLIILNVLCVVILSATFLLYAEYNNAECWLPSVHMLNAIILIGIYMSVILMSVLDVVILSATFLLLCCEL